MEEKNTDRSALTKTSKYLCKLLRHEPQLAGVTLDEHGWADVSELLRGVNRTHPLTMEQLEQIVRTDGKQRYSFNEDKTKIRANQGHSISVDVELEACQPPELLYHGTGEKYLASILKNGLLPRSRLYVHLSPDPQTARIVGSRHGRPVILLVHSGQMSRDGIRFFRSVNGVWLTERVAPGYFEVMEKESHNLS